MSKVFLEIFVKIGSLISLELRTDRVIAMQCFAAKNNNILIYIFCREMQNYDILQAAIEAEYQVFTSNKESC